VARMLGGITVHELIEALGSDSASGPSTPPRLEATAAPVGAPHSTLAMLERLDSSRD
jgi:mycobactin polyketide synthetase MbtD